MTLLDHWAKDIVRRVADHRATPAEVELVAEAVIEELLIGGQEERFRGLERRLRSN